MLNIEIENKPYECVVEIHCTPTGGLGNITLIKIKRRQSGSILWTQIYEKPIATIEDMTFTYRDNKTRSHRTYEYMVVPVEGGTETIGTIYDVLCEFNSIYLADTTGEWVCHFNTEFSIKKNVDVGYVKPLTSRFPKVIRNGDGIDHSDASKGFYTGSVKGLFIPKDASGKYLDTAYINAASQAYRERLMDFLCNGKNKILRTGEGHMWCVSIDGDPSESNNHLGGAAETQFNWREIDLIGD